MVLGISSRAGGPAGQIELNLTRRAENHRGALLAEAGVDVVVNAAGRVWQMTEAQMLEANTDLVTWTARAQLARRPGCRLVQLDSIHEYAPAAPASAPRSMWAGTSGEGAKQWAGYLTKLTTSCRSIRHTATAKTRVEASGDGARS